MAVQSVFISSVQRGFEHYREAARRGVQTMRMHPMMAEDAGARAEAPRTALLDEVADADVYLLVLGGRYGQAGKSGYSPTEDEFNHAVSLGKPILVLVQEPVDMEPAQAEFLARLRAGGWEKGELHGTFSDPAALALEVVKALQALGGAAPDDEPAAQERAVGLARGRSTRGTMSSGVMARVVFAPVTSTVLLDALALDEPGLADTIAGLARTAGLIPQSVGLNASLSSDGVALTGTNQVDWITPTITLAADGTIVAEGAVHGEGSFGSSSSVVDEAKTSSLVQAAGLFAEAAWDLVDPGNRIRRVATVVAIPDANYKSFGAVTGGPMSMPSSNPEVILAPDPPYVAQRAQIASEEVQRRLVVSLKRAFADLGAVTESR